MKKRYWLRGGVIVLLGYVAIMLFVGLTFSARDTIQNLIPGILHITVIGNLLIWFIIGCVIGWIYGKTINKI